MSTNPFIHTRVAITGGTSGLGLALVRRLHAQGAHVAFVARHRDRVAEVAREHPGTHGIVGDVSIKGDIYPIALQILGDLGGLDVLVNNASDLDRRPSRCWATPNARTSSARLRRTSSGRSV